MDNAQAHDASEAAAAAAHHEAAADAAADARAGGVAAAAAADAEADSEADGVEPAEADAAAADADAAEDGDPSGSTKACMECGEEKAVEEFPRNRRRLDGRDNRCKRCTARMVSARLKGKPPVTEPTVASKVCSRCGESKGAAEFNANKVAPDGLCSYCKPCNAAAAAARRARRPAVVAPSVASKICSHCQQEKPASEFHRSRSYKDGLFGQCRECCAAAAARRAKPQVAAPTVPAKACSRCGHTKSASDFNINKTTSSGLTSHCKECIAMAAAERKKQKALVNEPTVAYKVCGRCRRRKKAADFHRTRTRSDGLSSSCKACRNQANSAARAAVGGSRGGTPGGASWSGDSGSSGDQQPPPAAAFEPPASAAGGAAAAAAALKTCIECQARLQIISPCQASSAGHVQGATAGSVSNWNQPGRPGKEPQPLEAFAADARKLDGLRDVCQLCRTAQLASARGSAVEAVAAGPMKVCRRCNVERPTSEFHRQLSRPDGLYSYCVFCASEYKLQRKAGRAAAATAAAEAAAHQQAQEAAAALPAKRSRDGRPRRAAAARRRASYDDDDPDFFAAPSTGPLDALVAVGAAKTAADEGFPGALNPAVAARGRSPAGVPELRGTSPPWGGLARSAPQLFEQPAAGAAASAAAAAHAAAAAPDATAAAAIAAAAQQHANQQALAGRLAEAARAVGLPPIQTSSRGRSASPEPRRDKSSGSAGRAGRTNLSGGSGDDWWRSLLEPSGASGNLRGGSPPSWDKDFDARWYSGLGAAGGSFGAPPTWSALQGASPHGFRGPSGSFPAPTGTSDPIAAFWGGGFPGPGSTRAGSFIRGASGDLERFELGSTTSELTGVRGMSPVAGGSADSLNPDGVVETRGGQLETSRGDVSSPSSKRLRTSTAPSLPSGRLGSLSSADLCAVAALPPRPQLAIARLDPTASLAHSSGGGNGNGGSGNGGDTPRSGLPRGAGASSGRWGGATLGSQTLNPAAQGGGARLPPVSEAAVAAAAAEGGGVAARAAAASAAAVADQHPGAAMPPPPALRGRSDGTAGGSSQATGTPLNSRPLPAAARDENPTPVRGGREDAERHSGSGGSSNSPDEGAHGQQDADEGEDMLDADPQPQPQPLAPAGFATAASAAAAPAQQPVVPVADAAGALAAAATTTAAEQGGGGAGAASPAMAAAIHPAAAIAPAATASGMDWAGQVGRRPISAFEKAAAQHRDWQAQQQQGQGRSQPQNEDVMALGGLSPKASGSFKVSDQGAFKPYSSPGSSPAADGDTAGN